MNGVARVDLNGVEPRELFVDLILDKIKEHSVDVGSLAQLLQSVSSNLVLGRAESGGLRYTVRSLGAFDSMESLANLVIDERGLRLGEVAEITYEEPPIAYGRHLGGKYAVALDVYKESTANTVEVVREVTRVVNEDIDAGMGVDYEVTKGEVSTLRAEGSIASANCPGGNVNGTSWQDSGQDPVTGEAYYYVVRTMSSACVGIFGTDSSGDRVEPAACQ